MASTLGSGAITTVALAAIRPTAALTKTEGCGNGPKSKMLPTVHQVFASVEPYAVIADLKLPFEERDGAFFTPHPQDPEYELQIHGRRFIGSSYSNPTVGCNLFDFLGLHFGSVEQGIDFLIARYFHLARKPPGVALVSLRESFIESVKSERQRFEDILALREPFRDHSTYLTFAYMYCRRLNLKDDHAWRMFWATSGQELNQVLHYAIKPVKAFEPQEYYFIFPYLQDHHTFSMLQVEDANSRPVRNIMLVPSSSMFFGLHSCLPSTIETRVFGTRLEALQRHSRAIQDGDFRLGFLHVELNPTAELIEPPIAKAVFVATAETDFNTLARTQKAFERLDIVVTPHWYAGPVVLPWRKYAINRLIDAVNEDKVYSPRVSAMVQTIQSDASVFSSLVQFLKNHNQDGLLEQIDKRIVPAPLFRAGEVEVLQMPSGYAVKTQGNVPMLFTNFLIQISRSISFEDSQQVCFGAQLQVQGRLVPLLIADTEVLEPNTILIKARRAALRAGTNIEAPTFLDPGLGHHLVRIISLQLGGKPALLGVQSLGWNTAKTRFLAPVWAATAGGVQATAKVFHSKSKLISSYFGTQEYPTSGDLKQVTHQARYLIALLAASLTRAFLNYPIPMVSLLRSVQTLILLRAVFRPLGQQTPVALGADWASVQRSLSTANFSGYPLFATCPDPSVLAKLNYPLFLLVDSGRALNPVLDDNAQLQIAGLAHQVISSLVIKLMREPVQAHGLIASQPTPAIDALALEGKRIIEASCGIANFELAEPTLPLLQKIFSRLPLAQAHEYLRYDQSLGVLYIRCRHLPDVTRKPLFEELAAQCPQVKLHGSHDISSPADWLLRVLSEHYGQPIVLPNFAGATAKKPN
jgi:hypothetical protein